MRSWFFQFNRVSGVDWDGTARESVARALAQAPELAETHLAAAMLATHEGRFPDAARSLTRALHIAPTYADAHEYLGTLQCEAGQADEGVKRLRLADELDPTLAFTLFFIARHHALRGELDLFEATLAELRRRKHVFSATWIGARAAAWRGDLATLRAAAAELADRDEIRFGIVGLYCRAFLEELDTAELERAFSDAIAAIRNPRYLSYVTQLAAEVYAGRGDLERAHHYLHRAATGSLVDIEWLDRCALLAPLRALPDHAAVRRLVRERAIAIWAP
jgi:serine/threonine-protein kinase